MLFTTTTQWVALAVTLIAGWLFGLASHPGGAKWKRRYAEEREAHAATRRDLEARLAERDTRHRELEQENARLGRVVPVTASTVAPHAHAATASDVARPAYPARDRRGWFEFGDRRPVR